VKKRFVGIKSDARCLGRLVSLSEVTTLIYAMRVEDTADLGTCIVYLGKMPDGHAVTLTVGMGEEHYVTTSGDIAGYLENDRGSGSSGRPKLLVVK